MHVGTKMKVITLLTDFGTSDYFVASMKGVILKINPNVYIIDIAHDIPKYDIRRAAIILYATYKHFPKDTIHVVVVDPGVGTQRRGLVIRTNNYYFVGPDNGVLIMAALDDGIKEIREITNNKLFYTQNISHTFHGRDIFAPIAAHIAKGTPLDEIGNMLSLNDIIVPEFTKPKISNSSIEAEVIYIDSFGNVYTNITKKIIDELNITYGKVLRISFLDKNVELTVPFVKSYGYVKKGEVLCLINSEGFLELSANLDNFAKRYNVSVGDRLLVKFDVK